MLKKTGRWMVVLAGVLMTFGCASTEATEEAQRREKIVGEDNIALRQQLDDLKSTEAALSRELELKGQEVRRLTAENASLHGQVTRASSRAQKAETSAAQSTPAVVASVSVGGFRQKGVETIKNSDGSLTLRLAAGMMFASGKADLTKAGRGVLDGLASKLRQQKGLRVSVEGHTDATPLKKTKAVWGTNLGLSLARAMSVQDYLKSKKGISESRMRVVGYGEHRPLAKGSTAKSLAKNRRVELILTTR